MANPNTPFFPYAVPTDADLAVASDNAETTLDGDISNSDVTIGVVSTTSFTAPCLIVIDGEIILANGVSGGNTFTTCVRGFAGTAAASHTDTTSIFGYIVAYHHNQMAVELESIGNVVFQSDFSGLKKNENLLARSEAFESSPWALTSGATISATTGTSPIGDTTARTLLEGASLGVNAVASAFTSPSVGATYTFSVYAKYTNNRWLTIGQNAGADATRRVSFDIQNGVVGTEGSASQGSIVPIGSGWYRCLIVTTCTASADKTFYVVLSDSNGSVSYLGTSTKTALIWGAQVRLGGFDGPLTYIKTTGVSVSITGGGDLILDEGDLS